MRLRGGALKHRIMRRQEEKGVGKRRGEERGEEKRRKDK